VSALRRHDDGLRWRLRLDEHALLVMLLRELDEALDGPTDDPVVERLFPPAVEGDRDEDEELRLLIAGDLLLRRHEAIRLLLSLLERAELPYVAGDLEALEEVPVDELPAVDVVLVEDEPGMVLSVLNDLRLALASRVGLTAVELPQLLDEEDERSHALLAMMDHLAYLQMQLLRHIDPVAVAHAEPDPDDRRRG
jgi:hypothetical protein